MMMIIVVGLIHIVLIVRFLFFPRYSYFFR